MNDIDFGREQTRYQLRKAAGSYWLRDMEQTADFYRKPLQLNETGADIWNLYVLGKSHDEIVEILVGEYGVEKCELQEDVAAFFKMLQECNVL